MEKSTFLVQKFLYIYHVTWKPKQSWLLFDKKTCFWDSLVFMLSKFRQATTKTDFQHHDSDKKLFVPHYRYHCTATFLNSYINLCSVVFNKNTFLWNNIFYVKNCTELYKTINCSWRNIKSKSNYCQTKTLHENDNK